MFLQIENLKLYSLKPSEAGSRDAVMWICGMPRLRMLHASRGDTFPILKCSFHDGFYREVEAGAPSLHVSWVSYEIRGGLGLQRPGECMSGRGHHFLSQEYRYHYRDLYKDYSSKKVNDSYIRSCSCGKSHFTISIINN